MEDAFDIQHDTDPAQETPPARRIPHLGHTVLFFSLAAFCVLLTSAVVLGLTHSTSVESAQKHALAFAAAQAAGYVLALACSIPLFPLFWHRPFFDGLHLNLRTAQRQWWKLLALGIALSLCAQFADRFVKQPDQVDLLELFKTPLTSWIVAILGSLLPAFMEEVAFRGFLLPSLATAYEWLSLERTPAGVDRWQSTVTHSRAAWIFASVFSSLAFAGMHAGQLHGAIGPVAVIFAVSLVFSAVRCKTGSVAASTLVHMAYDGLIFAEMAFATGGFRHLDKIS